MRKYISDFIINNINHDYLLPSIQREFVWLKNPTEMKVEKLFDSIMQGYPFGEILVWEVGKELMAKKINLEVYNFIQYYDKYKPHNTIASLNGINPLYLVLDGQQRLSALNLGLRGIIKKGSCESKLYVNLLSDIENDIKNDYGYKYEFKFLSVIPSAENELWFEVGKVLNYFDRDADYFKNDLIEFIMSNTNNEDVISKAVAVLETLHNRIIGSVSIKDSDLIKITVFAGDDEKALNVFVRTNDGGAKLEKSDLLLSYMESAKNLFLPKGARKEINHFVDQLNKVEERKPNYQLDKDDVLKASLVLTDLEVRYKLKNFNKENLKKISGNWNSIKKYLEMTIKIIGRFGFSKKNVVSKNSLIPIAYFLMSNKLKNDFVTSKTLADLKMKKEIIKWLVISQLTGLFGSSSDSTLNEIRKQINSGYSFNDFNKNILINKESVENWINSENYTSRYTHLLLLLTTSDNYWDDCELDHIFPKSKFNEGIFGKMKLSNAQIKFYNKHKNSIVNLQLLNPYNNKTKSDDFIDFSDPHNKEILERESIPVDKNYKFKMFEEFIEKRKKLMTDKIFEIMKTSDEY